MSVGNYNKTVGSDNPSMFVILLDQSGSMVEDFAGSDKMTRAAQAVNRVIAELGRASLKESEHSPRCWIEVIGYGNESAESIVSGMITDVMAHPTELVSEEVVDSKGGLTEMKSGIWVKPKANGGTPMTYAYERAAEKVSAWIQNHPDCFPPVVINITDGEPNRPESAKAAANRLMELASSDGQVLLMNAHIQETPADSILVPVSLPESISPSAKFLFDISSEIPDNLLANAISSGLPAEKGSRAFLYRANAEALIKLINFGSSMGFKR